MSCWIRVAFTFANDTAAGPLEPQLFSGVFDQMTKPPTNTYCARLKPPLPLNPQGNIGPCHWTKPKLLNVSPGGASIQRAAYPGEPRKLSARNRSQSPRVEQLFEKPIVD